MMLVQIIILQVLVFGAVIFFLKKILYNNTQSAVNRLDKVYQDLLVKQKELAQKIQQAEKDYKEKREEASEVAEKLKQEALDESRKKEAEILKEAKAEADEMVQKARSSADKIRREIEKEVQMEMTDFVIRVLGTGMSEKVVEAIHKQMVTDFISKENDLDFTAVSPETQKVVIKSPLPLDDEEIKALTDMVERKLGRSLEVECSADKELIGGVALSFDTLLLDGSFANAISEAGQAEKRKIELEA